MKLSIIIPCYNVGAYVERAVCSVLEQPFEDWELILVDDGSTDDTLVRLKKLAGEDNRIQIISQKNKGVSAARNVGLEKAQGNWILFIDGDDWIESEILSTFLSVDLLSVDILIFAFVLHKPKGKNITYFPPVDSHDMFIKYILGHRLIIPCMAFRRSLIIENNLCFDEHTYYGEDKEFMMKALLLSRGMLNIRKVEYHYDMTRMNSAMNSSEFNEKQLTALTAIDRVVEFTKKFGNELEQKAINIHQCISTIFVYRSFLVLANSEQRMKYDAMFEKRISEGFKIHASMKLCRYVVMFYLLKSIYLLNRSLFKRILSFI
jgi:glycosyltransferase involved in cell wall biosynthesis